MNWKTIFIIGLGILSTVVLYYCYKRYYNKEGFQADNRVVRTETFGDSPTLPTKYIFSGSILTLREIYSEIIRFLTDYRNYSGYANAKMYTYFSNKYKKNLTIVDFSYPVTGKQGTYWFPYTGQYGNSSDWLTNFERETNKIIDLDIYNNNLDKFISFIKNYSGSNKQKFIFNRSLVWPSLIYRNIDLTQPPTSYNLRNSTDTDIIDIDITKVAQFNQNYQSWYTNFISYARTGCNIYPQSDYRGDTQYRILYSGSVENDKPPNLTYSNVNSSRKAGEIFNLIPDRKNDIINEQLELNLYGSELNQEHINDFQRCMFLGSVFTNFDDQYNLDSILRVPYNDIVDGSNCFYSFNMFLPEFTYTETTPTVYKYLPDSDNITYNSNLLSLRSGNTIKKLTFADLSNIDNETFINNVNTTFQSKSFEPIDNSNEAYVGQITPEMMAKIPPLARRYITSWTHNRSRKYLSELLSEVTGPELNSKELEKAQYICLAIRNFTGSNLDNFLKIYTDHGNFTTPSGTFTEHAVVSNVPNENAARRIVASSRIYNSYQYTTGTLRLSRSIVAGNVFNKMRGSVETRNEFRNASPTKSITGDIIAALVVLLENIGATVLTFPTDGIETAVLTINSLPPAKNSSFKTLSDNTYVSVNYVKTIMGDINRTSLAINSSLNNSLIDNAMIMIKELEKKTETTNSVTEYSIVSITGDGTKITITTSTSVPVSIGDYISISGTTNYNNNFYNVLGKETTANPTTHKITVISSNNATESMTSSAKLQVDTLYKYLQKAKTNTDNLRRDISGITISDTTMNQTEKDKILKNIDINKKFIDSFVTYYDSIKMNINSIYKAIDIIQMINKIITKTRLAATWSNTISYNINDYVIIRTTIYQCIRANRNISPAPIWSSTITYNINDYVKQGTKVYRTIESNTNITPPNTTYWQELNNNNIIDINGIYWKEFTPVWSNTITYDINDYVKLGETVYKCIQINKNISPPNVAYWKELTDSSIRSDIGTKTNSETTMLFNTMETAKTKYTDFIDNLESIKTTATTGDSIYADLLSGRNAYTVDSVNYREAQLNINTYLNNITQYRNATSILRYTLAAKDLLDSTITTLENLKITIGETGPIADAMAAPTTQEILKLKSDFENLIHNNKLLPDYGDLKNLNISDPSFLNSIAQLYYESSDGLYEMTTIYDVYMIGSNSVDIRFDKKQRLPKGRINNLNIQYLPEIQNYNRLLDIMDDGSWSNYYTNRISRNEVTGQILTKEAIDFYYEDLSAATSKLDPIFNPVYPIDQTINVKDLQIELSNLNTSNNLITKLLSGILKKDERPYIPETQETVGYNYTDRLTTIQYGIPVRLYTIETQISGILQSCARVFITPQPLGGGKFKFPINGMAIGVNAALTYNLAYNGNLEVDMANTQGNIGQYYPTIIYTKNATPPIVCGDIKFINKAVSLFNQTAFLNLSSATTKITGDDLARRTPPSASDATSIASRINNFYDSNDGPLYVDKILGFQQVNSNTCYYKWQETQYDPLTNAPFITNTNIKKQRTVNVQYQFIYDNIEYQNPKLIPDNNPGGTRPNEGFRYLSDTTNVLFGDLYLSLYSWYAATTRDLYGYINEISNKYNTLYTPQYATLVTNYNSQTSNLSTLNHSTMALFSTNLTIATDFRTMFRNVTVTNSFDDIEDKQIVGTCDSINIKPPIFTNNYSTITYNYRPGDAYGLTKFHNERQIQDLVNAINRRQYYDRGTFLPALYNAEVQRIRQGRITYGTYNKYRTVNVKDFFNDILNRDYRHNISKCDNPATDPENCFTMENDVCKYTYAPTNSELYRRIAANIGVRENIQNAINNTNTQLNLTTSNIEILLNIQTQSLLGKNVVKAAGRSIEQIYPEISNINNQITALLNSSNNTRISIEIITRTYNNLLASQTSDSNLPIYMRNQVIPIIKPLPYEALSLDTQYGQCPDYSCTSPVVMNSLVEQYNLDSDYDDTITSILKGATASPYQCDYLVEVRKKNAIVSGTNILYSKIKFIPRRPSYSDNRPAIYFPGNNFIQISNSCINLDSNNFTIDWFQYPVFDTNNSNPFIFLYGSRNSLNVLSRNLAVQFITNPSDNSIINFIVHINNVIEINVPLNYNQLNRWSYFAIVRYNNVITCYKEGYAFISIEYLSPIVNSSTVYIGSDSSRTPALCFKGGIRNFSFNNYDALYMSDIFNTVPIIPIKNINTKFIIDENTNNILNRYFLNSNVTNQVGSSPGITQTYLTNGALLSEIFRGNNQNNGITIDPGNRIYISDTANHVIKVREANGIYTTIIGTGVAGRSVSGTELLKASLNSPSGLSFGNTLYIADSGNNRICYVHSDNTLRELITNATNISHIAYYSPYLYYVNLATQTIGRKHTVLNEEPEVYITLPSGSIPTGISFDNVGNLYIADYQYNCIYMVLFGSTTRSTISLTGINKPLSVTVDLSRNLYIANSGDNKVYVSRYNSGNRTYGILQHIAGDGTSSISFNEGYARIIPLMPKRVLFHSSGLYIVDSRRICITNMGCIPSRPSGAVYKFNNSTSTSFLRIGSEGEFVYKFNKNLFTIQWFMFVEGSGTQTIFTFETTTTIQLGVILDIGSTTTSMNLYINGRIYPYNSQNDVSTPIEFNNSELVGLWVHMAIVHNGTTLSIYKNSILIYSLDSKSFSFNSNDSQLTIGNRLFQSSSLGYKGQMRSFMIYNKLAKIYRPTANPSCTTIEPYTTSSFPCSPNLVLHLANGAYIFRDTSITSMSIFNNSLSSIDSYPYSDTYNTFKIRLNYSDNQSQEILYNSIQPYGTEFISDLPTPKSIVSFNIFSLSHEKSIQQWLLQGSSDNGVTWDELNEQSTPYTSRSLPIYPRANSYSRALPVTSKRNIGGDIVKMTKSFQVATLIEDCSYVITSNFIGGVYTKGVTSSNGFFIQENTPYIEDTSGSDVSGFQFIGNLLGDYKSNIQNLYDPIISDSYNMLNIMSTAYEQSRSDTYNAVGKLNRLEFYSNSFNTYDTLRSYIISNVRFRNTIFDGYSDSNSYMSNIIRFSIVSSNSIDIVFDKVDLTGLSLTALPATYTNRTTTAAARYSLSVTPGFLDLTATFLSNVTPTANIFNDDFTPRLNNPRAITYKDRLYQRAKLSPIRTVLTSVTTSSLPTTLTTIETLTGLTGIIGTRIVPSPAINTVEYMVDNEDGTLPISKTNYIVQYVSETEVNSIIPATLENTLFKEPITVANIVTLIDKFRNHFNELYINDVSNNTYDYPYSSVMRKVYSYSIVNNVLYVSCSVEYKVGDNIYYNKTPNIQEFNTQLYYKVVFKTNNDVLAFEPCSASAGGALTTNNNNLNLVIEGTTDKTDNVVRNEYKRNLLFRQITFIPNSLSYNTTYSITQIEFFNSALLTNDIPIRIDSISIDGGITDDYDLINLIDGLNPQIKEETNVRIFTHTYEGGEITARFNQGTSIDGFSFMTGYIENNPQGWTVKGTTDGITWIELVKQDTNYNPTLANGTQLYTSFYRTPIFSFIEGVSDTTIDVQPTIAKTATVSARPYKRLRISNARSLNSTRFQLTNISLYNGRNLVPINPVTEGFTYLFDVQNLNKNNPNNVTIYEYDNNTILTISLTSAGVSFNGISFVSGIDVDKCMDIWTVEASVDTSGNSTWEEINKRTVPYINTTINYPHFFCRTPIFYNYRASIELTQPTLYDIKNWPITYVRFTPIYMYGENSSTEFEISHFEFFKDGQRLQSLITNAHINRVNNNLLVPYINTNPTSVNTETTIDDLTIFRGTYQDDTINFQFSSSQNLNGFSFMSGPDITKCVQLWKLEVSMNGSFWVTVHSTPDNEPYSNRNYPSSYYRLPLMTFFKNIRIDSTTQYYIISGTPTDVNNNGSLFKIMYSYTSIGTPIPLMEFTTIIDGRTIKGVITTNDLYLTVNFINWSGFIGSPIGSKENVYFKNVDGESYKSVITIPTPRNSIELYPVKRKVTPNDLYFALLDRTPSAPNPKPDPIIYGESRPDGMTVTPFYLYTDKTTSNGRISSNTIEFNTNIIIELAQLKSWVEPTRLQGFTNYKATNYINRFLLETNRPLNSELFRLIGPNSKVIDKKFYRIEVNKKVIIIHLNAHIEVIGYTISTGLYSHLSDPTSWKVFGLKDNKWILLDKQDNYDIPVERSYTLPPFYFNSKKNVTKDSIPDIKIIEDYYKKKINPFGKAVFKKYMFDNKKTYYMVFDEYDNNRNLIDTDLVIGFVMAKGVVKKPVMYENSDGSFDAFNLKKKEMMAFWKKKIGLNLETKYLSDY